MAEIKTFRCDIGKQNYSQLNNKINPSNTCNTTAMMQALDYMGYKLPDDEIFPEFKQPEDKLTAFCYTDENVKEYYKKLDARMFNQWQNEMKTQGEKKLTDYRWKDSYPPNEVHAVLSYATNEFMKADVTKFTSKTIEGIASELTSGKPVVISVQFGKLGHILCLTGVDLEKVDEEHWKPVKFYADDTYGKFSMNTKKYDTSVSGNDSEFDANELVACMKPLSSREKWCHVFNMAPPVI